MVNATSQTTSNSQPAPSLPLVATQPVLTADPSTQLPLLNHHNGIQKMKNNLKYLLTGLVVFVLVAGGGMAFLLTKQSQDVRQQASTDMTGLPVEPSATPTLATGTTGNCNEIKPVLIDQRAVWSVDKTKIQISWLVKQGKAVDFEIWNIGTDNLNQEKPSEYYLVNLTPEPLPSTATSFTVVDPKSLKTNRFLIRAVATRGTDGKPACSSEWPVAPEGTLSNDARNCTVSFTIVGPTATPTVTPTATPTPIPNATATPTPRVTPVVGCNDICVTNADCSNASHICFAVSETENRCRLETNPTNSSCQNPAAVVTQAQQPVLPEALPETGPEDWGNWLKAGLAILGIGAALLLML